MATTASFAKGSRLCMGVHENMTVWPPGETPQPKPRRPGKGRPPTRLHRDAAHRPVAVKKLAFARRTGTTCAANPIRKNGC
jgi:SRSO17 transposase